MDSYTVMLHYLWIVENEYKHSTQMVKNEFALSTDSWIHYVWIKYYSQKVYSAIHEAFV